ncbi:glycoside hydrolase family 3 C-terminal domain-containing protein [Namhaeicola litoreus]|uniref:Glycoside hydrolase family 3 C-terminal domain-containing protein n=1 Tax=Namhaeicola litoreus TaxID=1052145 RepID=A0ABW3Y2P9_9FLAO
MKAQKNDNFKFLDPSLSVSERVDDLIDQMTIEEKIGQLSYNTPAIERLGVPEYNWWNESLHGVARAGRATVFPQAIGLAATFDTKLIEEIGDAISTEARAKFNEFSKKGMRGQYQGLTFWSPNVNIFRDPRWGRGQETYGEDPLLTAKIGVAYVKGLQGNHPTYLKAAGMAKHYAVHNGPEGLRHEFDAKVSQKDLWETYLPAFEAMVKEGNVEGIMGAYNRVNGYPCSAHPYLMGEVLRKQWGFKGYFVSDCWAIVDFYAGHKVVGTAAEAAAMALNAGCNLNCGSTYPELIKSLEQGLTTEKEIHKNLKELLPTRFKLGLFDPVGKNPFDTISSNVIRHPNHLALAREAAAKSIVLLKNEMDVLPISKDINAVYVVGPTATHAQALLANYYGVSEDLKTILEGIVGKVSSGTSVTYSQGALLDEDNRNPMDWFSGEANGTDVTIACVGISQLIEGEEGESIASRFKGDRDDIGLPQNQIEFLKKMRKTSKKLVVVVTGGSAISMPEVYDLADALVYVWYPGEQGGNAVADVLFGDVVPSGRLPVTVPQRTTDLPPYEDYSLTNRTYRYLTKEPLFPFGFGLSYVPFVYENLQLDKKTIKKEESVNVSFTVQNKGDQDAEEVVQLYIKDLDASVVVPNHSLKDFQRVYLKSGEKKEVTFVVSPEMLKLVNDKGEKVLEKGKFKLFVGGSQPDHRSAILGAAKVLAAEVTVK